MNQKHLLKLLILVPIAAVLAWALLGGQSSNTPDDESLVHAEADQLVSTNQPESKANDNSAAGVISGNFGSVQALTQEQNATLNSLFEQALASTNEAQAIARYTAIIEQFPSAIEPHLNLAAVYAKQGQLEKARETLMHGFEQNPNAGLLFSSLQELHSALAAAAYSKAVNTSSSDVPKVALPSSNVLLTTLNQQVEIVALNKQISALNLEKLDQTQSADNAQEMLALTSELSELKAQLDQLTQNQTTELAAVNSQLVDAKQSLLASQEAEREALARVVRAEQDASAQLSQASVTATELAEQESAQKIESLQAQLSSLENQLAAAQQATLDAVASNVQVAPVGATNVVASNIDTNNTPASEGDNQAVAIALVQSWAQRWSAQDVDAYVAHYADNYSSSSSLSRRQWLEQRQERLTNKAFITVKVSDFKVTDLDGQFAVTFAQNYKSNTVDDTVTKRLVFNKKSDTWSNAKIVNESIVSR
jgi:hypothetical protein